MSPTVLRVGHLRFYFSSREEPRMPVHVEAPDGEAKPWLEPASEVAHNHGFSERDLRTAVEITKEHRHVIRAAWLDHFGR